VTTPNAELAYKVLDHIDAHPEQWDQKAWLKGTDCGTAACFAGWAVVLAGHDVTFDTEPEADGSHYYATIDGSGSRTVSATAARDLGIEDAFVPCRNCAGCGYTSDASHDLFDSDNDREDLGRIVAEIFGPRPAGGAS
jgi:hypothetical protein